MHSFKLSIFVLLLIMFSACKQQKASKISDQEIWKMGWRLIENSMDENFSIAESQFDSLLSISNTVDRKFLVSGLEVKSHLDKKEEIENILREQSVEMRSQICMNEILHNLEPCNGLSAETVGNEKLQLELIRMYIDDQACRGNIMNNIIDKYDIPIETITKDGGVIVDERNRERLKEVFYEFGFPRRELVGKDAMYGIFLMIQHSDGDKEWQKMQLPSVKKAVKNGDLQGQSYAYLYDRIKINGGEKQLYGSQFSKVDPVAKTVELADTEDLDNLNLRRREMGMMPIEMYKRVMLKNL